jgi:HEPN domain-containing protein
MQTPLQQANEFAASAEQFANKGDIANAYIAHFRAAELFLLAINDTTDSEVHFK